MISNRYPRSKKMNELLAFTDSAVDFILAQLKQEQGQAFRVTVKKTGCSGSQYVPTVIQDSQEGDIHFMVKDQLKVYVDPACLDLIKGLTVDLVEEKKEN